MLPPKAQSLSVRLRPIQRRLLASLLPDLADQLKREEDGACLVTFTLPAARRALATVESLAWKQTELPRYTLRTVAGLLEAAIEAVQGIGAIPPKIRVYQLMNGRGYGCQ